MSGIVYLPPPSPFSSTKSEMPQVIMSGVDKCNDRLVCVLIRVIAFVPKELTFGCMNFKFSGFHSFADNTIAFDIVVFYWLVGGRVIHYIMVIL